MLKGGGFVLHDADDTSILVGMSTRSLVGNAHKVAGRLRPMSIGERVLKIRTERKLSQAKLAKEVGVTQQLIGQIENGENQGTKHIVRIAAALGVSVLWLESGEGEPEPPPPARITSSADQRLEAIKARLGDEQKHAVADMLERMFPPAK